MLNKILLIQTPQDVADLATCVPILKKLPLTACWVIYSPAVVVDVQAIHDDIDKLIIVRNQAIKDAVGREDYIGAEQHRVERDGLILRKAAAATDGLKNTTPEQRAANADKLFKGFYEAQVAPSVSISEHTQHYETKDWNEMVNGVKGRWPSILPHGAYSVEWPNQILALAPVFGQNAPTIAPVPVSVAALPPEPAKDGYMKSPRFKFLCALGTDDLGQEAFKAGVKNPKGTRLGIVHQIMKAEATAAPKAA